MRKYLIISFLGLLLFACKTAETPVISVPINTITKVVEHLVPVVNPADSANVAALFECNSSNKVIMKELNEVKSKNMQSQFSFTDGTFKYKTVTKYDTIFIRSKDSTIYKEIPITVKVPFEVNRVTAWQTWQIYMGRIFMGFLLIFGGYKILKFKQLI